MFPCLWATLTVAVVEFYFVLRSCLNNRFYVLTVASYYLLTPSTLNIRYQSKLEKNRAGLYLEFSVRGV